MTAIYRAGIVSVRGTFVARMETATEDSARQAARYAEAGLGSPWCFVIVSCVDGSWRVDLTPKRGRFDDAEEALIVLRMGASLAGLRDATDWRTEAPR